LKYVCIEVKESKSAEAEQPKLKLHALEGLKRWKQEAAVRVTEKKKKKLTLKGYSKVSFIPCTCQKL